MTPRSMFALALIAAVSLCAVGALFGAAGARSEPDRLTIVWTSADPDVAHRMTLMYAEAAQSREWFREVRVVIWGPSQRLVVADKDVRASIARMIESGVIVEACLACADLYGIADDLRAIDGVTVKYMGQPLTEFLKDPSCSVITF